jgi:hypothetical protein
VLRWSLRWLERRRVNGNFGGRLFLSGLDLYGGKDPIELTKDFITIHGLDRGFHLLRIGCCGGFQTQGEFVAASVLEDVIELHLCLVILCFGEAFDGFEFRGSDLRL